MSVSQENVLYKYSRFPDQRDGYIAFMVKITRNIITSKNTRNINFISNHLLIYHNGDEHPLSS